jgi:spore coat protein U-like protein
MKKILILVLFLAKIAFATCSLSIPTVNLGNYNKDFGNSSTFTISYTCSPSAEAIVGNLASANTLFLNGSNGGTAATVNTYDINNNIVMGSIPNISWFDLPEPNFGCWSCDSFRTSFSGTGVVKVPSGLNLTPGTFNGNINLYQVILDGTSKFINNFNLPIIMNVPNSCLISTPTGINFGSVSGTEVLASGIITSNCTIGTTYTLTANAGSSGSFADRKMFSGINALSYNLFIDSSKNFIWGGGVNGNTISLVGNGTNQITSIYGKVYSGQQPAPGNYSDDITVILTY